MPKKYPTLTPGEVIDILLAWGFVLEGCRGSHCKYEAMIKGRRRIVTVDTGYDSCSVKLIKSMIHQSGLTRKEFYGATKKTAKKIGL